MSAQVEGRIVASAMTETRKGKPVDYGSRVEKGQVLAIIDDSLYQARLDGEQASLHVAEAKLELAKVKLEAAVGESQRVQALVKTAAVPQAQADSRQVE